MKNGTLILWSEKVRVPVNRYVSFILICICIVSANAASAQCPGGYTQAQLNWDHMEVYWNSGNGNGPYSNNAGTATYISDTREMTQKFGIGRTWLSMVMSSNALLNPGTGNSAENATHTGEIAGFTGEDVQFNPNANGQTITITFATEVRNASFTLYDIDASARIDIDAYNTANVAQNVDITTYGTSDLAITGDNNINTFVTSGTGADRITTSNQGTATATIGTAINRIVITVTTIGGNAVFWLSDINACVLGSLPLNYHQTATPNLQPFTGPVANQPQYFLATPDNDGIYMVDPATGNAKYLTQDATKDYVNSFAYDPVNRILYYISENPSVDATNRELKKYNFNTNTFSTVLADISTLGIPTFNMGIESAGAAFYDGALYLGIEGGNYNVSGTGNDRTRETIVWRIEFDGSLNAVNAFQVYSTNAYTPDGQTSTHDYGDFLIRDGEMISFNTARNGSSPTSYAESKYHHFNMTTGVETVYANTTTPFLQYSGQGGLSYNGNLYWLRDSVGRYNGNGTVDPTTKRRIVVVAGPNGIGPYATWGGPGTGDASDPFRPKSDFGDAPASYDPNPQSPATHEVLPNLRIGGGSVVDEWVRTPSTLANAENSSEENGVVGAIPAMPLNATYNWSINLSVFNNTGAAATLVGWLDYNNNGTFEAGEGRSLNIPNNASAQSVSLSWNSIFVPITTNTHSFLRLRITRAANGMTTANGMNGWFPDGEVEDWAVLIGSILPKDIESFSVAKKTAAVDVRWSINVQQAVDNFEIYRSDNNSDWTSVATIKANDGFGLQQYLYKDNDPLPGMSYYRVKVNYQASGENKLSEIRSVRFDNNSPLIKVLPNPASSYAEIKLTAIAKGNATIEVFDQAGRKIYSNVRSVEAGLNKIVLDNLSSYTAGIYMVQVKIDGRLMNSKLVINK